jgi:hypothetical protein
VLVAAHGRGRVTERPSAQSVMPSRERCVRAVETRSQCVRTQPHARRLRCDSTRLRSDGMAHRARTLHDMESGHGVAASSQLAAALRRSRRNSTGANRLQECMGESYNPGWRRAKPAMPVIPRLGERPTPIGRGLQCPPQCPLPRPSALPLAMPPDWTRSGRSPSSSCWACTTHARGRRPGSWS